MCRRASAVSVATASPTKMWKKRFSAFLFFRKKGIIAAPTIELSEMRSVATTPIVHTANQLSIHPACKSPKPPVCKSYLSLFRSFSQRQLKSIFGGREREGRRPVCVGKQNFNANLQHCIVRPFTDVQAHHRATNRERALKASSEESWWEREKELELLLAASGGWDSEEAIEGADKGGRGVELCVRSLGGAVRS